MSYDISDGVGVLGDLGGLVCLNQGAFIRKNSGRNGDLQGLYRASTSTSIIMYTVFYMLVHLSQEVSPVNIIKGPRIREARIPHFVDNFHRLNIVFAVRPRHD